MQRELSARPNRTVSEVAALNSQTMNGEDRTLELALRQCVGDRIAFFALRFAFEGWAFEPVGQCDSP